MPVVTLVSAKGSPGVTTAAAAIAAAATVDAPALLVELDPAGGDVRILTRAADDGGLVGAAGELRRDVSSEAIGRHISVAPPGVPVLLAPTAGLMATSIIGSVLDRWGPALHQHGGTVIVDAGRWDAGQPTSRRVGIGDIVALVCRPTVGGVEHARQTIDRLREVARRPVVALVVGTRPYAPAEVAAELDLPLAGAVSWDPRGAAALWAKGMTRSWGRTWLAASATEALEGLTRLVPTSGSVPLGGRQPAPRHRGAAPTSAPAGPDRPGGPSRPPSAAPGAPPAPPGPAQAGGPSRPPSVPPGPPGGPERSGAPESPPPPPETAVRGRRAELPPPPPAPPSAQSATRPGTTPGPVPPPPPGPGAEAGRGASERPRTELPPAPAAMAPEPRSGEHTAVPAPLYRSGAAETSPSGEHTAVPTPLYRPAPPPPQTGEHGVVTGPAPRRAGEQAPPPPPGPRHLVRGPDAAAGPGAGETSAPGGRPAPAQPPGSAPDAGGWTAEQAQHREDAQRAETAGQVRHRERSQDIEHARAVER